MIPKKYKFYAMVQLIAGERPARRSKYPVLDTYKILRIDFTDNKQKKDLIDATFCLEDRKGAKLEIVQSLSKLLLVVAQKRLRPYKYVAVGPKTKSVFSQMYLMNEDLNDNTAFSILDAVVLRNPSNSGKTYSIEKNPGYVKKIRGSR